jgi:hypothetical protein
VVLDVHHEQPWMMMMMMLMMMMTQPSYLWKTVQGNARNMSCLFFSDLYSRNIRFRAATKK